jgi:enoyl-CoA hydratase/carnithine racemase
MADTPGRIRVEREGHIGWIVFDHPQRRNAITAEMWNAMPGAARELEDDPEVRVVVLRGEGEVAFVSGADISEFGKNRTGDRAADYDIQNARAFGSFAKIDKPVIAMVHGFCVGGGCAIALTADLRFAADDAVFGIPAARLGLGYSAGGIEALVNTVGLPAAKEIFFTARRFDAGEAHHMGLVNRVFPKAELEASVRKIAEGIAENAPLTLRSAKKIFAELSLEPAHRDNDGIAASIRACFESDDYREGVRAFLEKRPAVFKGR